MGDIESLKAIVDSMATINATSTGLSAIAAIGSAITAFIALRTSKKSSSVMMVLEIENQMNERKSMWDKAATELRQAEAENKSEDLQIILCEYVETTKENYFNSLDRLCFCISKNYLKEKDWKVEYRNLLNSTIQAYSSDFNSSTTPYRNVLDLNNKWQRS
jgi:hypothetical protein